MSGAFRFWKRILIQGCMSPFSSRSAVSLAAVASWVVWKRTDRQADSNTPIPCEKEFQELKSFYDKVKSPENLNFFNRKAYMRLERNLRTCAALHPGFYERDSSSGKESTVGSSTGHSEQQPLQEEASVKSLEERMKELEKKTWVFNGKDVVVYLPKEEQDIKSTAKIRASKTSENRGPYLSNGDINWRCLCIERLVVGPCNVEFRAFRERIDFMKDQDKDSSEQSEVSDEEWNETREIVGKFFLCTKEHEKYYDLGRDDDDDVDEDVELYEAAEEAYNEKRKQIQR